MSQKLDSETILARRGTEIIENACIQKIDEAIENIKDSMYDSIQSVEVRIPIKELETIKNLSPIVKVENDSNSEEHFIFLIDKKAFTEFDTKIMSTKAHKKRILNLLNDQLKKDKIYEWKCDKKHLKFELS